MGPPKVPTFLEAIQVNNLVLGGKNRKTFIFPWVFGAHGIGCVKFPLLNEFRPMNSWSLRYVGKSHAF